MPSYRFCFGVYPNSDEHFVSIVDGEYWDAEEPQPEETWTHLRSILPESLKIEGCDWVFSLSEQAVRQILLSFWMEEDPTLLQDSPEEIAANAALQQELAAVPEDVVVWSEQMAAGIVRGLRDGTTTSDAASGYIKGIILYAYRKGWKSVQ